jgi:hypothetical protein
MPDMGDIATVERNRCHFRHPLLDSTDRRPWVLAYPRRPLCALGTRIVKPGSSVDPYRDCRGRAVRKLDVEQLVEGEAWPSCRTRGSGVCDGVDRPVRSPRRLTE